MVRSSFSVFGGLGHLVPFARDYWASGGETGPSAASSGVPLSPRSPPRPVGCPPGPPCGRGSLGASGVLLGGRLSGPYSPLRVGVFGRDNPLWTLSILGPPPWCSVGLDGTGSRTGQVLGRVRFSGGTGSRGWALVGVRSRWSWADGYGACWAWVLLVGWRAGIRLRGIFPCGRPVGRSWVWSLGVGGTGRPFFQAQSPFCAVLGPSWSVRQVAKPSIWKPRHVVSGVGSLNPGPALRSSSLSRSSLRQLIR